MLSSGHPELRDHRAYLGGTPGPGGRQTRRLPALRERVPPLLEYRVAIPVGFRRQHDEAELDAGTGTTEAKRRVRERVPKTEAPAYVRAW